MGRPSEPLQHKGSTRLDARASGAWLSRARPEVRRCRYSSRRSSAGASSAVPAVKWVRTTRPVDLGRADRGLEHSAGGRRAGERFPDIGFEADLSGRHLAERDDGRLVALGVDMGGGAGRELPGAASRENTEGEAVVDEPDAVLDGDASHGNLGADGWGETVLRVRSVLEGFRCRRETARTHRRISVAAQQQLEETVGQSLTVACAERQDVSGCSTGSAPLPAA